MTTFRSNYEHDLTFFNNRQSEHLIERREEWFADLDGNSRIDEEVWKQRYSYESRIISHIIKDNNFYKILELGSGPGSLCQLLMNEHTLDYTLIDQPGAYEVFKQRKFKGNFLVKDLMNTFDISDMNVDYDFIIANDFLEHIYNPSIIVQNVYKILKDTGMAFISVPNWRMGHTFIYRGLFDYDNFIYFMYSHGFELTTIYNSPLICPYQPKLSSETEMDDRLIQSWNWYFLFQKRK